MASRYSFYNDVIDTNTKTKMKGTLKLSNLGIQFINQNATIYEIPIQYSYRPDLIAYKFYKDSSLDWVITFANNFTNSPEDYTPTTSIIIPALSKIKELL